MLTRRQLFQTASAALAGAVFPSAASPQTRRVADGWEHYRGSLSGIWELWRGKAAAANVTWEKVGMPHCYNAWDAVDPDRPYYQGPAWYRTTISVDNPFASGRTLLHFEGVGQTSEVFVGLTSVGRHVGGYDEFTYDITSHNGDIQLAVCCDNSRSTETIPSDQSDFNRYGGLYRHVNLEYVPAVSLERMLIDTNGAPFRAGENHLRVVARQGASEVEDEIRFQYRTETWGKPASLVLEAIHRQGNVATLRAHLLDAKGVPCLDARNVVRFAVAGDGQPIANLGTVTGSRQMELANGRAMIRVRLTGSKAVASVSAAGVASGFCTI
jgi:hypothetical protein